MNTNRQMHISAYFRIIYKLSLPWDKMMFKRIINTDFYEIYHLTLFILKNLNYFASICQVNYKRMLIVQKIYSMCEIVVNCRFYTVYANILIWSLIMLFIQGIHVFRFITSLLSIIYTIKNPNDQGEQFKNLSWKGYPWKGKG